MRAICTYKIPDDLIEKICREGESNKLTIALMNIKRKAHHVEYLAADVLTHYLDDIETRGVHAAVEPYCVHLVLELYAPKYGDDVIPVYQKNDLDLYDGEFAMIPRMPVRYDATFHARPAYVLTPNGRYRVQHESTHMAAILAGLNAPTVDMQTTVITRKVLGAKVPFFTGDNEDRFRAEVHLIAQHLQAQFAAGEGQEIVTER